MSGEVREILKECTALKSEAGFSLKRHFESLLDMAEGDVWFGGTPR